MENFWEDLKTGKFAAMVKDSVPGASLKSSNETYNVLKPMMAEHDDIEVVYGIFMDAKNRLQAIEKLATGSLGVAVVFPREIVKRVIALKTSALVLAHNHPSGDTAPSPEDLNMTLNVLIALKSIGTTLHDHIIVGNGYYSMADNSVIGRFRKQYNALFN